jgi:hypothetical protein
MQYTLLDNTKVHSPHACVLHRQVGAQATRKTSSSAGSSAAFPELNWATQGHAAESEYQRTQRLAREMEQLLARRRRENALRYPYLSLDESLYVQAKDGFQV